MRRLRLTDARLVVIVLGGLAVVLAVALAATVHVTLDRHATERARDAASKAAFTGVQALLSYDYRHVDAEFTSTAKLLTGQLAGQYAETRKAITPAVKQSHAVVTAAVKEVAVTEASPDRATALVFVDQVSTNSQLSAPRAAQTQVQVTLVQRHGRWLLAELTTV